MAFYNKDDLSYGKEGQDHFAIAMNRYKTGGTFVEIGSNHAMIDNNSYLLEKKYGWKGLMVEYDRQWELTYKDRVSKYIIEDATKLQYHHILNVMDFPSTIDYLQIDLDEENRSTLNVLELFEQTVFPNYKFNAITFEHDIYRSNVYNTREASREIFKRNGYVLVFPDVRHLHNLPMEDWYIHSSIGDDIINGLRTDDSLIWMDVLRRIDTVIPRQ